MIRKPNSLVESVKSSPAVNLKV